MLGVTLAWVLHLCEMVTKHLQHIYNIIIFSVLSSQKKTLWILNTIASDLELVILLEKLYIKDACTACIFSILTSRPLQLSGCHSIHVHTCTIIDVTEDIYLTRTFSGDSV